MRNKMCRVILFNLILIILNLTLCHVNGFNIESKHYTSYKKETRSMFGFSVAQYRDINKRGWVIVGAPEAQTSQPNVYRGGGVFRCDIALDDSCVPVEFDRQEHNYLKNPEPPYNLVQIDNKTLQWFGATVSTSQKDGGQILACAPRYVFFTIFQKKDGDNSNNPKNRLGKGRDPVGTCWVTDLKTSVEYSPCRTYNSGYHRQGSCQAGFGAAISKTGDRIFIGAPGSWYWQGQLYSVMRSTENFPFMPPVNASFGVFKGQTYAQKLNDSGKVLYTKEGPKEEDDSYLGYSVTSGDFNGNGDIGTAVGMPRSYGLNGKVVLFTSKMKNYQNITGEQMGSYFGYSLTSGDIDGDGKDDLIVGAPMYTLPDNPEMNIETGRIYVFYGKEPNKFRDYAIRDGESNRGRFGLSLASLGDLDRDGYYDFAVGAPYAGSEGRGAVYIYHGSREGVTDKYTQVIYAEEIDNDIKTFGFSINGGLDLDGNYYPDMVVGSYESDTAMFFRSRPVIKMLKKDTFVEFNSTTKLISLDDKNCILSDKTQVTCLELKACLKYNGDGVLSSYNFNVQYVLDIKKSKNSRMFFIEHEGRNTLNQTIRIERNQQFCRTVRVYITPSIRDKLTSLDAEMRMTIIDDDKLIYNKQRDPRLPLRPVLATTSSRKDTLSIRKNCGSDNICTPNLQLKVESNVNRYLLGSGNRLILDILVQNQNEDAFEATYNLVLPAGVDYIKIERIDKTEIPVQCSAPKQSNNNTLRCDIGNPLPKDNLVRFNVLLQPINVHEESSYEFDMSVNSTNSEPINTLSDNYHHLSVEIWVDTELVIEGESKPKDLYYNPDNYTTINITNDTEYGPVFIHNYTIRNNGPSRIEEAEIFLIWPAATLAGDDFVYLLEQPETTGPLICATANANPLSLKLEQRKKYYPTYTSSGIINQKLTGQQNTFNNNNDFKNKNYDNRYNGGIVEGNQLSFQSQQKLTSAGILSGQVGNSIGKQSKEFNKSEQSEFNKEFISNDKQTGSQSNQSRYSGKFGKSSSSSSSNKNNDQVKIHIETGNSFGVDDASLVGVVNSDRGTTLLTTTDTISQDKNKAFELSQNENTNNKNKFLQGGNTFIKTNESYIIQKNLQDNIDTVIDNKFIHRGGISTTLNITKAESDRRYLELRKEQRRKEEEQKILLEKKRKEDEENRLFKLREQQLLQRKQEEENRRIQLQEEEEIRRKQEEEQIRNEEDNDDDDDDDNNNNNNDNEDDDDYDAYENEKTYEQVNHSQDEIRPNNFGIKIRNITSKEDVQNFFNKLKETVGYDIYNKEGSQYLQFLGRYRVAIDKKEYIEFKDGSMFPLQNNYGKQIYSLNNDTQNQRYLRIDGKIITDNNGKIYCQLSNNKKFPLQNSWSYSEERTYTSSIGGITHDNGQTTYDNTWKSGYENRDDNNNNGKSIETYQSHEEKHTSSLKQHNIINKSLKQNQNYENRNIRDKNFDNINIDDLNKYENFARLKRDTDFDYNDGQDDTLYSQDDESTYSQNQETDTNDNDDISKFCTSNKCVNLRCTLGRLEKDQEVSISARFRIKGMTLKKIALDTSIKTSTQLISRVTKLPFIGKPSQEIIKNQEVSINVIPTASAPGPDPVPLWVVVLSACAGTIILLLLIYLLHKCGFFKRNRPTDAPERQPLNRNCQFNGDEQH